MYSYMVMWRRVYRGPAGIPLPIGEKEMARRWTTIKIPSEVLQVVRSLRERTGKASWQVIVEALSFYDNLLRKREHYSMSSDVDKIAYYILKLVTSATYLKMQQNHESLEKFKRVVEQVQQRLNISCEELIPAAEKMIRQPTGRNVHTFNMILKSCIVKLIFSLAS